MAVVAVPRVRGEAMTDRPPWLPASIAVASSKGIAPVPAAPIVYQRDGTTKRVGDWTGFKKFKRRDRSERELSIWAAGHDKAWDGIDGRVVVGPPITWRHWVYDLVYHGAEAYFAFDQALLPVPGLAWLMGAESRADLLLYEAAGIAHAAYCPLVTRRFFGNFETRTNWVAYNCLERVVDTAREYGATVRQESYDLIPKANLYGVVRAMSLLYLAARGNEVRFKMVRRHQKYLAGRVDHNDFCPLGFDVCHRGATAKMRGIWAKGINYQPIGRLPPSLTEYLRDRSPRALTKTSRFSPAEISESRQKAVVSSRSI